MAELLNVVIDISHHNGEFLDFVAAREAGIVGVIAKATQGTTFIDPMYAINRIAATAAGLLWGAYHFGDGSDPATQAAHFLAVANPAPDTLLALDYETNPGGTTMSLAQAEAFIVSVGALTGRFPGLYSGNLIKEQLGTMTTPHPVFSRCWLWLAQYGPAPTAIPPTWSVWTLWQYTDGAVGPEPHTVPGIGVCDRDRFNGGLEGLLRLWGVPADGPRV